MPRYFFCLALFCVTTFASCGSDGDLQVADMEEDNLSLERCGPNAVYVSQPGIEAQCVCLMGFVIVDGICQPEGTPSADMTDVDMIQLPNLPDSRALPDSCFIPPRSYCDPRNGEGCDLDAGETCDLASTQGQVVITCLPGPNTAMLGQACNSSTGPFCMVGLRCTENNRCAAFCCGDEECAMGESCVSFSTIQALGVCQQVDTMPMCDPAGAVCVDGFICCSGECSANHCM